MSNCIKDFSSKVHDNIIQSYIVDLNNGILKMGTCWEDKENTKIEFIGLLAHKFENVIDSNIIFGIYQTTIQSFIDNEKENLTKALKYGYPTLEAGNCDELKEVLENDQYKVFRIDSTLGLCGYVIAKDIKIITKKM